MKADFAISTILFVLLGAVSVSAQQAAGPSTGLVAAYSLNEGSGTTVGDSSGNSNTGTITGATWTTAGKYGSALSFNGTNAKITINNSPSLNLTTGMTLEAWVNPAVKPPNWQSIIDKDVDNYYLMAGSALASPASGGTFSVGVNQNVFGRSSLAANTWVHLAATYDGTAVRLYVNGVLVSSQAQTGAIVASTKAIHIGADFYGEYFNGVIDEARIYNRALSQAEIQTDMSTPIGTGVALDTTPPAAPSSLTATATSSTQINLSWTASTDNVGVTGYRVERCQGASCTNFAQIGTSVATTFNDTGLAAATSYSYRVRATDAANNLSPYSAATSTSTGAPPVISVTISPLSASVQITQTQQFSASVQNDSANKGVTWSLTGTGCAGAACGTLTNINSSDVTYNAPVSAPTPNMVVLTATSVSDGGKSSSAAITISTPSLSASPTLVQHASGSNTANNFVTSYTISLPDGTQAGNCVVVGVTAESARTITVSDDRSNTYNLGNLTTDTRNSQVAAVFYALNVAAGARTITISFSTSAAGVGAVVSEFYNVATAGAMDGNSGNFNSGTSVAAGSITTTADNDLIYQFAAIDSGTATSFTQGASPWILLSADVLQGQVAQYGVQTTHGAINPTLPQSPSANSWVTSAIALKSATAGSAAAAGIRIVHLQHNSIGGGSTQTFGFPCSGNLIVVSYIGSSTEGVISSISDSNGNAYTNTGTTLLAAGKSQMFYAKNAACSTAMTMTLTMSAAAAQATAQVYDITGADPSAPFDKRTDATGSHGSTGNFNGVTITPTNSKGIIISSLDVANGFISALVGASFDSIMTNPNIVISPVDENNGWGHFYNSNANAVTLIWTSSETAASTWGSIAAAFKAPGVQP
jgi:chitodextrinase